MIGDGTKIGRTVNIARGRAVSVREVTEAVTRVCQHPKPKRFKVNPMHHTTGLNT